MRTLFGSTFAIATVRLLGVAGFVILVLWPQFSAVFGQQQSYYLGTVILAAITTMLAISLNLAMGYAGLLSFLHTGFLAVGGYVSAILMLQHNWNPWLSIVAAMVVTTLFAMGVTVVSVRATNIYWGLITLSFDLVVIQIAQQWNSVTGGFNGLVAIPRPNLHGAQMSDRQFFYVVIVALVLVYLSCRNIVLSGAGRSFRAVRESEDISTSLGIDPTRARLLAFALSGAMAGLAGALYAMDLNFISPDVADQGPSLALFIGIFLGGFGTLLGPVLGMVVVTAVQSELRTVAGYSQLILGCFLLAAILILPRGIVGTWTASRWSRPRARRTPAPTTSAITTPATVAKPSRDALLRLLGTDSPGADVSVALDRRRLVAENVSKSFGGVQALNEVSFELSRGTVHGLIGPNGAGKSTFGSCLSAQLHPDSGTIELNKRSLPRRPHQVARGGLTRVFQVPHLLETATVTENLLCGMHMRIRSNWLWAILRLPSFRREEKQLRRQAVDLLTAFGLAQLADRPASILSHGQKRLVEIARAIATRPSVLILDEPATGLTPSELDDLYEVIGLLREAGLAILLIEHNMEFVMRLCDEITVLNFGEVIAHGVPSNISASAVVREAYLGGAA